LPNRGTEVESVPLETHETAAAFKLMKREIWAPGHLVMMDLLTGLRKQGGGQGTRKKSPRRPPRRSCEQISWKQDATKSPFLRKSATFPNLIFIDSSGGGLRGLPPTIQGREKKTKEPDTKKQGKKKKKQKKKRKKRRLGGAQKTNQSSVARNETEREYPTSQVHLTTCEADKQKKLGPIS